MDTVAVNLHQPVMGSRKGENARETASMDTIGSGYQDDVGSIRWLHKLRIHVPEPEEADLMTTAGEWIATQRSRITASV